MEREEQFIDSGWRVTIPKSMRKQLGWTVDTVVCMHWDGFEITVCNPRIGCQRCPDISRVGTLGKVVIPPRVREEANLYPGQVLSLSIRDNKIIVSIGEEQIRCSACGSEVDVKQVLSNVHLCRNCRDNLHAVALKAKNQASQHVVH